MSRLRATLSRSALTSFFLFGLVTPTVLARDLSRYRDFQLGTDLSTVAKQTGASPSQAKVIHHRPAFIQELKWQPQPLGLSSKTEPAQDVVFTFYDGELFRIVVNYDRYETEGLTSDDIIEAISATYGIAAMAPDLVRAAPARYADQEDVLARWQDPQYRFELIRSSYGPSFRLVGVLKRLEAPARAAIREASRLDDQEAPQREAARIATEEESARARLQKARLVNKPKFRP